MNNGIDQTVQTEKVDNQAADYNNADKMRHVGHSLRQLLEFGAADLIQDQRKQDGNRKSKRNGLQTQNQCIAKQAGEVVALEKGYQMLQANKFTRKNGSGDFEVGDGNIQAGHRRIAVYREVDERWQSHEVQNPVLLEVQS